MSIARDATGRPPSPRLSSGLAALLRFWAALLIVLLAGAAVLQSLGPPRHDRAPTIPMAPPEAVTAPPAALAAAPAPPRFEARPAEATPTQPPELLPSPPQPAAEAPPPEVAAETAPQQAEEAPAAPAVASISLPPAYGPVPKSHTPPQPESFVPRSLPPRSVAVHATLPAPRSPVLAAAPERTSGGLPDGGQRCRNILGRAQLGEELSDEERSFLRAGCRSRR